MWSRRASFGAPADMALGRHTGAVERATIVIGCNVNKPVQSSLHFEKIKIENLILDSSISIKIINSGQKQHQNFFNNMVFTQNNP